MKYIDGQIATIRENHENFTFTDRALCMTVFDGLKQKEEQIKAKLRQIDHEQNAK
jgi:hypothetical protein